MTIEKLAKLEYRSPSIDNEGNIEFKNFDLNDRLEYLLEYSCNYICIFYIHRIGNTFIIYFKKIIDV